MNQELSAFVLDQEWGGPVRCAVAAALAYQVEMFDVVTPVSITLLARISEVMPRDIWMVAFSLHRPGVLEIGTGQDGPWVIIHQPKDEREAA